MGFVAMLRSKKQEAPASARSASGGSSQNSYKLKNAFLYINYNIKPFCYIKTLEKTLILSYNYIT